MLEPATQPQAEPGLSSAEAAGRLQRDGPNVLPVRPQPRAWWLLGRQLVHLFALMLWVAAGLAFLAGMPQLGGAIVVIILINGLFAFAQEYRSERAAEQLRDLLPRRATVRRDGVVQEIDAAALVVGDLVLLVPGDRVSADLELLETHGLAMDTSTLTGESVPARLDTGATVHAGTFAVEGEGAARVMAVGLATRLAGIARLTQASQRPPGPLALELNRVVRIIAAIAVGVGLAFFSIALLVELPLSDGFLFAIGVTVALVPEGLLPTVTLSLALGAQRMAARHALVRRLEAVETLGSTSFICTDKTGTLTTNEMTVVEIWTPAGSTQIEGNGYDPDGQVEAAPAALTAARELALAAARCSNGRAVLRDGRWIAQGDPMEAALDVLARRLGLDPAAVEQAAPISQRFPFDPRRRRMSVLAGDALLVKGAPDAVLPCCRATGEAAAVLDALAQRGLRVLAVARRAAPDPATLASPETAEVDLELLGLVGLQDPPRPHAAAAIAACRQAGIRVAMITGDHPATATAIARQVGIFTGDGLVLEGHDLPADEAQLGALLDRDGVVVSRVAPEDKLRIALALRARGHVVAMTGDGVNDGPALQAADIGISMGRSGTDVAREASDLVLLDDDFATIVAAIEQGRVTFANVRRFLTYHLTDNVAELTPFAVWALSGGRFPLAIGVLQILCLDLLTDQLPALALGVERPGPHVLQEPVSGRHLIDRALLFRVFGLLGPVEALFEMAAFTATFALTGWRPGSPLEEGPLLLAASGAAFSAVVIGQSANALACRSTTHGPGALGWATNPLMLWALASEAVLLAGALFVPPIAGLLGQAPPAPVGWLVAALTAPALLAVDALHKSWQSRRTA